MAFTRTRKIGKYHYRYLEERYREDGKVKSRSKCLGRVAEIFAGALKPIPKEDRGWKYIERWMERDAKKEAAKATAQKASSSPQSQATAQTSSHPSQATQEGDEQQGIAPSA